MREGWVDVELGEIASKIQYGFTVSSSEVQIGPKFLRITDIQNHRVDWEAVPYCQISSSKLPEYLLEDGDPPLARTGATVGKSFLIRGSIPEAVFASYLIRVRVLKSMVDDVFLSYFFHSPFYWEQIIEGQVGIGQPNVNGTKLKRLVVPLPPLLVQRRIVSAIETQLGRLDAAVARLHAAKAKLNRYKQALLKAAVDEAAEDPKAESVVLADVADLCLGKMLDRQKNVGTLHPYLRNINVRWGEFQTEDLHQMPFKDHEHDRYGLVEGDLVMCEGGEPGRGAVWDISIPDMKIQKALHRIRCGGKADPHFVMYNFLSACWPGTIDKYYTGTTIKHLTGKMLARFEMVLPPIKVQRRLVARIQEAFDRTDEMTEALDAQLEQSARLRQAVLKRAFEMRLV